MRRIQSGKSFGPIISFEQCFALSLGCRVGSLPEAASHPSVTCKLKEASNGGLCGREEEGSPQFQGLFFQPGRWKQRLCLSTGTSFLVVLCQGGKV